MRLIGFSLSFPSLLRGFVGSSGDIKIVTLGESTTADVYSENLNSAWPVRLEKKLRGDGFSVEVTNLATAGITTPLLLKKFQNYVSHHSVDIVVAMMGVNDLNGEIFVPDPSRRAENFLNQLRVVKIFNWLKSIVLKRKDSEIYRPVNFASLDHFPNSQELSERWKTLGFEGFLMSLGQMDRCKTASAIVTAMTKNFETQGYASLPAYKDEVVKELYDLCPSRSDVQFWMSWLAAKPPMKTDSLKIIEKLLFTYGTNLHEKTLSEINGVFTNYRPPRIERFFADLGVVLLHGERFKALSRNFALLKQICERKGVKLFIMQYPTLSLTELKTILDIKRWQQDGVVFVENRQNFLKVLSERPYEEIFIDRFQQSWGHTTALGHELISENIAESVGHNLKAK